MATYITDYNAVYTISGDNSETATMDTASADTSYACANHLKTSGKWYWEVLIVAGVAYPCIGVAKTGFSTSVRPGFNDYSWGAYRYSSTTVRRYHNNSYSTLSATLVDAVDDIVGVALDVDAGKVWFSRNGTWLEGDPAAGTTPTFEDADIANGVMPNNCGRNSGDVHTMRLAAGELTYTPPSGFVPIGATPMLLSGSVKDGDGDPLARTILIYYSNFPNVIHTTTTSSAVDGSFSVNVHADSASQKYMVIAQGSTGENSVIYDGVTAVEPT